MKLTGAVAIAILTMTLALVGATDAALPTDSQAAAKQGHSGKQLRVKLKRMRIIAIRLRAQRNQAYKRLKIVRSDRDSALEGRNAARDARDDAVDERDDARSERDDARKERDTAIEQRDEARTALGNDLSEQMSAFAASASLDDIRDQVLKPLEGAWPCEANFSALYDGDGLWSLSLSLQVWAFEEGCPYSESL